MPSYLSTRLFVYIQCLCTNTHTHIKRMYHNPGRSGWICNSPFKCSDCDSVIYFCWFYFSLFHCVFVSVTPLMLILKCFVSVSVSVSVFAITAIFRWFDWNRMETVSMRRTSIEWLILHGTNTKKWLPASTDTPCISNARTINIVNLN